MMKKDLLKGLSEEQIAKVKACKDVDELMSLAKREGVELTSEQLEAVSGGGCSSTIFCIPKCPECKSKNTKEYFYDGNTRKCMECGYAWDEESY